MSAEQDLAVPWVGLVVWLIVSGALWYLSAMIADVASGSGYKTTRLERQLAKLPGWARRIPTRSLPVAPPIGRGWDQLLARHETEFRAAHKGHQGLSLLPRILAWTTFLIGVSQLIFLCVAFFSERPNHWLYLSLSFSLAALAILVLDLYFQRKRWSARAPFEWRFATAATFVASAARDEVGQSEQATDMRLAQQRLAELELLEWHLSDRIHRPDSPSARMAAAKWQQRTRPLSEELASARLSLLQDGLPSSAEWIERAAQAIVVPTTRASTRKRPSIVAEPLAKAVSKRDAPADRAAIAFIRVSFAMAAGLGLVFYVSLVLNGEVAALNFAEIAPWLNGFVGVATVAGVILTAWHQLRR